MQLEQKDQVLTSRVGVSQNEIAIHIQGYLFVFQWWNGGWYAQISCSGGSHFWAAHHCHSSSCNVLNDCVRFDIAVGSQNEEQNTYGEA